MTGTVTVAARMVPDPRLVQDIGTEADWPQSLSETHRAYQRVRAVGPRVARERELYTATSAGMLPDLEHGGYSAAVRKAVDAEGNSAMVIPLYSATSDDPFFPVTFQLRLETPATAGQKFVIPGGLHREDGTLPPDVHPLAMDWLEDTDVPLIITEGQAKADSMLTSAFREGLRVCPVTLTGVTLGFIAGKDGADPRLAPGLTKMPLRGRDVYLAFDADSMTNAMVKSALRKTAKLLQKYGATVYIPRIPATEADPKRGADDYLAAELATGQLYPLTLLLNAAPPAHEIFIDEPAADLVATAMGEAGVTVPDLLTAWSGRKILVQDGVMAVVGGPEHGLWAGSKKWDEKQQREVLVVERITDWLAWRTRYETQIQIDARGLAAPVTGVRPRWAVEIIRADRRRWSVDDLSETESTDAARVVDYAGAAVALPERPAHRAYVANCLRILGADGAGQVPGRRFTSTGWLVDPEHGPTFVAPAGSMTADGPTDAITAGPPAGSDDDALTDAQRTTGWTHVAEGAELREAVQAFAALLAMAPQRPEAGVALIGGMAAAPLRLSRRCSVLTKALPKVGKSHLLGAASWFWNSTGPASFALDLPGSSEAAAKAVASWHRDAPLFADDFKLAGDEGDLGVKRAFGALARGAYTGASNAKATREGGMRRGLPISTVALMTGEEAHPDGATMQRVAVVELVEGDVDLAAGGAVDHFNATYGATGLARAAWAHYMRWLAQLMAQAQASGKDPLLHLRQDAEHQWRLSMEHLGTDRAGETASVVSTGWRMLLRWAREHGVLDLMPSWQAVIKPALGRLVTGNQHIHLEADPAARVLAVLADQVERRVAYVQAHDGTRPQSPAACGWHRDDSRDALWVPRGELLGWLSRDRTSVVVTPGAVTAAIRTGQLGIAPAKLQAAMTAAGYVGGRDVRHNTVGIPSRPRGWIVPVAKLGIDLETTTTEEVPGDGTF